MFFQRRVTETSGETTRVDGISGTLHRSVRGTLLLEGDLDGEPNGVRGLQARFLQEIGLGKRLEAVCLPCGQFCSG